MKITLVFYGISIVMMTASYFFTNLIILLNDQLDDQDGRITRFIVFQLISGYPQ